MKLVHLRGDLALLFLCEHGRRLRLFTLVSVLQVADESFHIKRVLDIPGVVRYYTGLLLAAAELNAALWLSYARGYFELSQILVVI